MTRNIQGTQPHGTARRFFLRGSLHAALIAGVACLAAPAARAADQVSLRLDWLPSGYHAPLFLAAARGYYEKQGIDLKILDGKGTNVALQAVASGNDTIAIANLSTMVEAVGKGMPVVGIGGLIQRLPDSIISLASAPLKTPKDLEGKTGSTVATSAIFKLFPAFAAATHLDMSKVKVVPVDAGAVLTSLLQGQVDFATGWAFTDALRVAAQKPIAPPMLMADYGINVLGNGFVVSRDTAKAKGDMLKRFMAATAAGYTASEKEPEAAIDAMIAARPEVNKPVVLEQLKQLPAFFATEHSKGKPFGWTSQADWEQTVDLLHKYFDLKAQIDIPTLYTNDFVPAS
jgi:NitT/TauT family transport system substrate-binding protein